MASEEEIMPENELTCPHHAEALRDPKAFSAFIAARIILYYRIAIRTREIFVPAILFQVLRRKVNQGKRETSRRGQFRFPDVRFNVFLGRK